MADYVELSVELAPHVIKQKTDLGEVPIELDQWRVRVHTPGTNPVHVGYLRKVKGSAMLWLPQPTTGKPWPMAIKIAILDGIEQAAGWRPLSDCEPPPQQPVEDDDEEELEGEDD